VIDIGGAQIKEDLICSSMKISNPNIYGEVLVAVAANIQGSIVFNDSLTAFGFINFFNMECRFFKMKNVIMDSATGLNLEKANIGVFSDDSCSWPSKENLQIAGIQINSFEEELQTNRTAILKNRISWLRLQNKKNYSFQPYEIVSSIFRKQGFESDAKDVLIKMENDREQFGGMNLLSIIPHWIWGKTISYGYKPERAISWFLSLIFIFWIIFHIGYKNGYFMQTQANQTLFSPSILDSRMPAWIKRILKRITTHLPQIQIPQNKKIETYPKFFALIFSIETIVPLIKLGHNEFWKPIGWCRLFHWLLAFLGWILSSVLVIWLAGLVKS
jgi:hypothetical protein